MEQQNIFNGCLLNFVYYGDDGQIKQVKHNLTNISPTGNKGIKSSNIEIPSSLTPSERASALGVGLTFENIKSNGFACGKYNLSVANTVFAIGIGDGPNNRANALVVTTNKIVFSDTAIATKQDVNNLH